MLQSRGLWPQDAIVLGHVPQNELKNLMSRSHVLVLPSIEEGLAMVMAQALACGCPIIASNHSGAEDLINNGLEGFIIPIRDVHSLTDRLQQMIDQPELRNEMSMKALEKVQKIGGWLNYGEQAMKLYSEVISA